MSTAEKVSDVVRGLAGPGRVKRSISPAISNIIFVGPLFFHVSIVWERSFSFRTDFKGRLEASLFKVTGSLLNKIFSQEKKFENSHDISCIYACCKMFRGRV